jgi:hypothetical protein
MPDFYTTFSKLEKTYWYKIDEVFSLASPQQPEKGLITIIQQVRKETHTKEKPIEEVLESHFIRAKERTERRVALLNQCNLK